MAVPKQRTDRLSIADERPLDPSSLVGSYFHSDHARGWQGCVVAEPSPGVYLVELFDWMVGESEQQRLIRLADMDGWMFYDTAKWMTNAYRNRVERRWARMTAQEDKSPLTGTAPDSTTAGQEAPTA